MCPLKNVLQTEQLSRIRRAPPETVDEVAGPEFIKTLKSIVLNVYREADAATVQA